MKTSTLTSKLKNKAKPTHPPKAKKPNKFVVLTLVLLVMAVAIIIAFLPGGNGPSLPPEDLVKNSIAALLNQDSLSYETKSSLIIGEKTTNYGEVKGEKSGGKLHVEGEILGSKLDLYQIDDTTYRLDEITQEWLVLPSKLGPQNSLLLNEIDPLTNFQITAISNLQILSDEFADEERCFKISFTPEPISPYFGKFFQDITYTLWINKGDHQIRKASICGKTQTNGVAALLLMEMDFWNLGETQEIEPPVLH